MTANKAEVQKLYRNVDKVLQPLLKGDGDDKRVQAARVAWQSLCLLRQAATHAALPVPPPWQDEQPRKRVRKPRT